jgi:hypothetical protein
MRIARFVAGALAVFALAGCDINTGPAKPAQTGCNCTTPPPPAPPAYEPPAYEPPVPHTHWRYHTRRYAGAHGYAWRREYAELSVETYDYRSSSRSYVTDEGAYAGGSYAGGAVHGAGWVDGYGRAHGGGDAGVPVHSNVADRARAAVWRGYDIDCPDAPDRRR